MTTEQLSAQERWPRVCRALAEYIAGPSPRECDLDDAAEAVGDYYRLRDDWPLGGDLKGAIERAVAARHLRGRRS